MIKKFKKISDRREGIYVGDYILAKLSAIIAILVIIKMLSPYSLIWIDNTNILWFVVILILIAGIIFIKKRENKNHVFNDFICF